jgi:hypothetical protein
MPRSTSNIFSAARGARWTAERDEEGEVIVTVRFTLRELLDRLEEIAPPGAEPACEPAPGSGAEQDAPR